MPDRDIIRDFQQAADVSKVGFAQFTTDLLKETADAIVSSTIRQIQTFSDLVKELAEGLEAFKNRHASPAAVDEYLKAQFPNADGTGTAIAEGESYDHNLYQRIVDTLGPIPGLTDPGEETAEFTADQVAAIRAAARTKLEREAEATYQVLENLVRVGFARVVFRQGHILTRLKFNVSAREVQSTDSSRTDLTMTQMGGSLGLKWKEALQLGFSASRTRITVETVNTRSFEALTMDASILGEVRVEFATESFDLEKMRIAAPQPA